MSEIIVTGWFEQLKCWRVFSIELMSTSPSLLTTNFHLKLVQPVRPVFCSVTYASSCLYNAVKGGETKWCNICSAAGQRVTDCSFMLCNWLVFHKVRGFAALSTYPLAGGYCTKWVMEDGLGRAYCQIGFLKYPVRWWRETGGTHSYQLRGW